ncbi:phage gp6-like head-tail connector protein [Olivibacter sp. LS-1]|nr:phage gp6-like head-tail connector protein [Olivibacter sp. LS-1]
MYCNHRTYGMTVKVIEDVSSEPVSLAEVKKYMEVDFDDWDDVLNGLIKTMRSVAEKYCNLSLKPKKLSVSWKSIGDQPELPYGPVDEDSVTPTGTITANTEYTYDTGYELEEVPEEAKTAIKEMVHQAFDNRGDKTYDPNDIPPVAKMYLDRISRNLWL